MSAVTVSEKQTPLVLFEEDTTQWQRGSSKTRGLWRATSGGVIEQVLEDLLLSYAYGCLQTPQLQESEHSPETSATTIPIEMSLRWLSEKGVAVPRPGEVRNYLSGHADMVHVVLDVCGMAWERFAGEAQLSLELYRDPEIEDEYLSLYVRQGHYSEDIVSRIEDVRSECQELFAGKPGWVLVTTDFSPPR